MHFTISFSRLWDMALPDGVSRGSAQLIPRVTSHCDCSRPSEVRCVKTAEFIVTSSLNIIAAGYIMEWLSLVTGLNIDNVRDDAVIRAKVLLVPEMAM